MSKRVLLVCTDAAIAAQVRSALQEPGTEIVHVATPQRAQALLDEGQRYDIVIADADMTPTGGFALSREIKARELMGEAVPPVALLITRYEDSWLASWSRADVFVRKPADPFDLAEVVEALVNGSPIPRLPGVALPGAAVVGDIFGAEQMVQVPETAVSAGP